MERQEQRERVARCVDALLEAEFGEDYRRLGPDDPLQEAGLDSVDVLDALAAIEKRFRITFDRDELVGIASLADLHQLVFEQLLAERGEDFVLE